MITLPIILIFSLTKLSASIPLEDFYPYGAAQGDTDFPKNDDGSSPVVTISTKFPFFNSQHDSLYVNTNGAISFLGTLSQYTPESFPLSNSRRIIAPFWADVDIRNGGTVWYRETTDSSILQRATDEVRLYYPSQTSFRADWVFVATWDNVAFYGSGGTSLSVSIFAKYQRLISGEAVTRELVLDTETIEQGGCNTGDTETIEQLVLDTETIEQGGCNTGGALTISPQYSNMFGGEKKVFSGPCIQSDDVITARFGSGDAVVHCTRESMYKVACVTPSFSTTGDVSVTLNVTTLDQRCNVHSSRQFCPQNTEYLGKITIQNPLDTKPVLQRMNPSTWIQGEYVTMRWQTGEIPFDIGGSSLEIFTVKPDVDHKPKIRHQSTAVQHISPNQSQVSFLLQTTDDVIILSLVEATNTSNVHPQQRVWSEAIVVTPRNTNESRMSCGQWQTIDDELPSLSEIPRQVCPCRFDQASIDAIRFRPDPLCQQGSTRQQSNCLYHPLAKQCFRLNTPGPLGTGQLCCYDNNGNIMDMLTSSGGGSLQRFHYFGDGEAVVPYLSNIVFDTAPYYHCCMYPNSFQSEVASECYEFYQRRTPGNCHEYVSNTPAQSTGVSHFVTPDGLPYTFNGVGEFTLFRTIMNSFIAQVRLEAFTNNGRRGALITSLAVSAANASDTVEIRLNSIRGFDILINGVVQDITGISFLRYKGATVTVVHNNSTSDGPKNEVNLAFPEFGISFQALVFDTHMNLGISFDPHFQLGSIEGLLGNFNHNASDDLTPQHGQTLPANSSTEDIHHNMGLSWRVKEEESLFTYAVGTSHSSIQDSTFVPTFEVPPSAVDGSMRAICGNDTFCYYDYYVTHDKTLALSTQTSSETLSTIQRISRQIVTCGIPPAVQYGQWNTSGMEVGDTGELVCNSETNLQGSGYITCNASGDWTDSQSSCVIPVVTELPTDGTTFCKYICTILISCLFL
ncbi:protein mesh-like [Argopecten irradians]|uniref:protein mesh-like n=1 Tax=Argopecten irradians TaxID=31199 RepID=UPI0037163644